MHPVRNHGIYACIYVLGNVILLLRQLKQTYKPGLQFSWLLAKLLLFQLAIGSVFIIVYLYDMRHWYLRLSWFDMILHFFNLLSVQLFLGWAGMLSSGDWLQCWIQTLLNLLWSKALQEAKKLIYESQSEKEKCQENCSALALILCSCLPSEWVLCCLRSCLFCNSPSGMYFGFWL